MWFICTVEYYSAINNETTPFTATQMDLKIITLSEISQTEQDKYYTYHLCIQSKI